MRQFLCAFALLVSVAVALKFELRPNEIQCFEEEMPDDVLVSGTFQSQKLFNQDLDLTVFAPNGKIILKQSQTISPRFAFTSQIPGDYRICFTNKVFHNSHGSGTMVVDLVLKLGSFAVDYEEIASKEGLKAPVDIEIRRMLDQANELTSTMTYMRIREEAMRNTNESTNARVMWFAILSIFIIISVAFWQLVYLRHYFTSRHIGGVKE